jgi:hypothetical protein
MMKVFLYVVLFSIIAWITDSRGMKRYLVTATVISAVLLTSGCYSISPEPTPTSTPAGVIVNPTEAPEKVEVLGSFTFPNDVGIEVSQVIRGTATKDQVSPREEAGFIVKPDIIIMKYVLTNESKTAVNVKNFIPWNASLLGSQVPDALFDDATSSLHTALGLASYPTADFNSSDSGEFTEEWMLPPGESAVWYLDWFVDAKTTGITHNFYLSSDIFLFDAEVKFAK